MTGSGPDELTPEGQLIERARERLGWSQNEAARRVDMSGTRWRQIITESMTSPRGLRTLRRIVDVLGITRAELLAIDRADVAADMASTPETDDPRIVAVLKEHVRPEVLRQILEDLRQPRELTDPADIRRTVQTIRALMRRLPALALRDVMMLNAIDDDESRPTQTAETA